MYRWIPLMENIYSQRLKQNLSLCLGESTSQRGEKKRFGREISALKREFIHSFLKKDAARNEYSAADDWHFKRFAQTWNFVEPLF